MRNLYILLLLSLFQLGFSQQITHVEYWFENGFANRVLQPITTNANNETDLNISFLDNGTNEIYDLIHYRFLDSTNNWSSIYSQPMFNANETNAYLIQMQYWFDNEFANRAIVLPTQYMGTNGLDRQEAEVPWQTNAQTIHYRFKSKYNQWSAIQSSNIDNIENRNNRIASAEYWLNNNFESRQTVNNAAENNMFFLDVRSIILNTDIQETIHLRYKDKMNRYSSIYSFHSDYQGEQIEPSPIGNVNLVTSKLPAGKVNLTWNSVENAKLYQIYRDGLYWRSLENTHHPQSLEATDFPPLGNHNYYVVAKNYLNPTSIISNTDDETIEQTEIDAQNDPANVILYGTINGMITDANGNRIDDVLITYSHDGYSVYSNLGQFKRDGILYDTKGIVTLSKPGFSFTPVTNANYNVTEPLQNIAFIGTSSNTTNPIADTQVFALEQSTNFSIKTENPQYRKPFETATTIKNLTANAWSGKIQLIAYKKGLFNSTSEIIIDEIQVSNMEANKERDIEFSTSELDLPPNEYKLKIVAYKIDVDVNLTIQDIQHGITFDASKTITVSNSTNLITRELAKLSVENAVNTSIFITKLFKNPDKGKYNKMLDEITGELQTAGNFYEKSLLLIDAIKTIDAILIANQSNEMKDYFAALIELNKFNTTPLNAVLGSYLEVGKIALDGIKKIKNDVFDSNVSINLSSSAKIKIKILKKSSYLGLIKKYFKREQFTKDIASIDFITLNNQGFEITSTPMDKIDCNDIQDDESLCLSPSRDDFEILFFQSVIRIIWTNGKITYIPCRDPYITNLNNQSDYECILDATKASGTDDNIIDCVYPNYK